MVMETLTSSRGMSAKRMLVSSTESMATPAMPTSPTTRGWSRVVAPVGGQVEGHRQAGLARGQVALVEGVGLLGGREPAVLAERPGPVGVHRGPHAADERRRSPAGRRGARRPSRSASVYSGVTGMPSGVGQVRSSGLVPRSSFSARARQASAIRCLHGSDQGYVTVRRRSLTHVATRLRDHRRRTGGQRRRHPGRDPRGRGHAGRAGHRRRGCPPVGLHPLQGHDRHRRGHVLPAHGRADGPARGRGRDRPRRPARAPRVHRGPPRGIGHRPPRPPEGPHPARHRAPDRPQHRRGRDRRRRGDRCRPTPSC